ncbi:energy transducer TonB, partial [Myxococcota bacterium]|nr:energy transducer TonB [Myxococcota bacterium]
MKRLLSAALFLVAALSWFADATPARAQSDAPAENPTIDQLLERVRNGWREERRNNEKREAEFRAARADQKETLLAAQATLAAEEARSERLEQDYEDNELALA